MNIKNNLVNDLKKIYKLRIDLKDIDKNNINSEDDEISKDYSIEIEKLLNILIDKINDFNTGYCDFLTYRQVKNIDFILTRGSHFNIKNFEILINEIEEERFL